MEQTHSIIVHVHQDQHGNVRLFVHNYEDGETREIEPAHQAFLTLSAAVRAVMDKSGATLAPPPPELVEKAGIWDGEKHWRGHCENCASWTPGTGALKDVGVCKSGVERRVDADTVGIVVGIPLDHGITRFDFGCVLWAPKPDGALTELKATKGPTATEIILGDVLDTQPLSPVD